MWLMLCLSSFDQPSQLPPPSAMISALVWPLGALKRLAGCRLYLKPNLDRNPHRNPKQQVSIENDPTSLLTICFHWWAVEDSNLQPTD